MISVDNKKEKIDKKKKLHKMLNKKTMKKVGIYGVIYGEIISKPKSMR